MKMIWWIFWQCVYSWEDIWTMNNGLMFVCKHIQHTTTLFSQILVCIYTCIERERERERKNKWSKDKISLCFIMVLSFVKIECSFYIFEIYINLFICYSCYVISLLEINIVSLCNWKILPEMYSRERSVFYYFADKVEG